MTANGCPTSMNLYNFSDNRFHCKKYYKDLINHIDNKKIKKIILHTRWGFYISGQRFNNEEGSIEFGKNSLFLRNEKDLLLNKSQQKKIVLDEIKTFIEKISKKRDVIVISSIIRSRYEVPHIGKIIKI